MFEAWLFVVAHRARLPDTVDFVLCNLFSIFACICAQRSAVEYRHLISGTRSSKYCRLWWQRLGKRELFRRIVVFRRVFNKGWQPAKLTSYSMWTHRLFDWEITSYFTTNMRNIRHQTRTLDRPRFIHENQKDLAWILSNFSDNLCFVFCPNTLILAPECLKWILRGPDFPNFPGEHTPGPS